MGQSQVVGLRSKVESNVRIVRQQLEQVGDPPNRAGTLNGHRHLSGFLSLVSRSSLHRQIRGNTLTLMRSTWQRLKRPIPIPGFRGRGTRRAA